MPSCNVLYPENIMPVVCYADTTLLLDASRVHLYLLINVPLRNLLLIFVLVILVYPYFIFSWLTNLTDDKIMRNAKIAIGLHLSVNCFELTMVRKIK